MRNPLVALLLLLLVPVALTAPKIGEQRYVQGAEISRGAQV